MLATAVVVSLVAPAPACLALVTVGHRLRRASLVASVFVATLGTITAGEIAARLFRLQS